MDTVGMIMDFEDGTLDEEGTLYLFAHLIKTGQAWQLQGSYGRYATALMEADLIGKDGKITALGLEVIEDCIESKATLEEEEEWEKEPNPYQEEVS